MSQNVLSVREQIRQYHGMPSPQSIRERTDALIDAYAAEQQERILRMQNLDAIMKLESQNDPIDNRLRVIVENNTVNHAATGGMAGGLSIFADISDRRWYKKKAAEHLLRLRYMRRWHKYHRGEDFTSIKCLDDAAHCRARAAGMKPLPSTLIIGL